VVLTAILTSQAEAQVDNPIAMALLRTPIPPNGLEMGVAVALKNPMVVLTTDLMSVLLKKSNRRIP
jgi:hypothetical protein